MRFVLMFLVYAILGSFGLTFIKKVSNITGKGE